MSALHSNGMMWPAILAVASALGLAVALFGDGAWDFVGAICLGLPCAAIAFCIGRSRRMSRHSRPKRCT